MGMSEAVITAVGVLMLGTSLRFSYRTITPGLLSRPVSTSKDDTSVARQSP